ncbi:MAG TPA: hypothetical protein VEU08_12370, partial [Vicinamibacterales bacterium]|nr:hypothetical protein [Vicinamibacterales bacterium]
TAADPLCGGALYAHIAYARQLDIKRAVILDALRRIGRLELPGDIRLAASPEEGYRMRARLHVRAGRIGFFREGTHGICDARATRQLLPQSCDALEGLGAALQSPGADAVREVELSENVDASQRVVALDAAPPLEARVVERLGTSIAAGGLSGVVSGAHVHGVPFVVDRVQPGGHSIELRRHVLAFFQGNRHLLGGLVAHVVAQLPENGTVVELYAGVGLFSVAAAVARGARVTAVEGDRVAASDLEANASASGAAIRPVHDSVERFVLRRLSDPPLAVVVDPPRTGLSREALDGAIDLRPRRIVYVSCDVATLARDARRIIDAGFAVSGAAAFDLFPNTPHVETVLVFDR